MTAPDPLPTPADVARARPTVEVECPVCSESIDFPGLRPQDHEANECENCSCIYEDTERECPTCGALVMWHVDDEHGWPWVDEYAEDYEKWCAKADAAIRGVDPAAGERKP